MESQQPHSQSIIPNTGNYYSNVRIPLGRNYLLFNRYRITALLSNGGFGMTYRAIDTYRNLNLDVVIKENYPLGIAVRNPETHELHPVHGMEETYRKCLKNFVKEAELLTSLNQPNIVRVNTYFSDLNTAYYVMPYIGGTELQDALPPSDILDEAQLLPVLHCMLNALIYMHSHGVMHRDIKPNNILIDEKNTPILIDFGLAGFTHTTTSLISSEIPGFSPGFSPIEQISGRAKTGFWTDIYSLGATCYMLITGTPPQDSRDRINEDEYIPLQSKTLYSRLKNRYSAELLASIDRALQMKPGLRWQNAEEWLQAIPLNHRANKNAKMTTSQRKKRGNFPLVLMSTFTLIWLACGYTIGPTLAAAIGATPLLQSWLILPGIDVNRTIKGYTPLQIAEIKGHTECVKLLQSATGNTSTTTQPGESPAPADEPQPADSQQKARELLQAQKITAENYNAELIKAAATGNTELLHTLICAGADVNQTNADGWNPLLMAAWEGHSECVKLLLTVPGIDIYQAHKQNNETPLLAAAENGHTECVKQLLSVPGIAADSLISPLLRAIWNGHSECVKLFLQVPGINVNQVNEGGWSPLLLAAEKGRTEYVKQLLDARADVNLPNKNGQTPLCLAAQNGHTECVRFLLTVYGTDVNKADINKLTPLHHAAEHGHAECVRLLLTTYCIDINKVDAENQTPLQLAKRYGKTGCVKLLQATAEIDTGTQDTALKPVISKNEARRQLKKEYKISPEDYSSNVREATESGDAELMSLLIAAGADINATEDGSTTPLYNAVSDENIEIVRMLIAAGADVNKADKDGFAPLIRAAFLNSTECMRLLLAAPGINVNHAITGGETPLYFAIKFGNPESLSLLLSAPGINTNSLIENRVSPLHYSVIGYPDYVRQLLNAGANPNAIDENGETPLHWAAELGQTECVRILLQNEGIQANKADEKGITPLMIARQKGHRQCAILLEAAVKNTQLPDSIPVLSKSEAQKWLSTHMGITEPQYNSKIVDSTKNPELLALLIAAGADVNTVNSDSYTALHLAASAGLTESIRLLLAAPGIDVNKVCKDNWTPLHTAARNSQTYSIRLLLAATGIDSTTKNQELDTPLDIAVGQGNAECVRLLLAAPRVDINKVDKDGDTLLHLAACLGYTECVQLLLSTPGINLNTMNNEKKTPTDLAIENGHTRCAHMIRKAQKLFTIGDSL